MQAGTQLGPEVLSGVERKIEAHLNDVIGSQRKFNHLRNGPTTLYKIAFIC